MVLEQEEMEPENIEYAVLIVIHPKKNSTLRFRTRYRA